MSLSAIAPNVFAHGASRSRKSFQKAAPAATDAPSLKPGDTFTVATYNCENAFVGPPEPGHDQKSQPTKSPESFAAASRVIMSTGADVVALQEVHDQRSLDMLMRNMPANAYPHTALVRGNDHRGITMAVISKYPIVRVESNASDRFDVRGGRREGFERDFLEATVKLSDNYEFTIGTTHLKSHSGGQAADDKRVAEGRHIHRLVEEELKAYPNRGYIVSGDLNDTENSPTLRAIVGKRDDAVLHDPLAGTHEKSHPVTRRRIDFLLLSEKMQKSYVPGSADILDPTPDSEKASDHLPVVAQFRIPN